MTIRRTSLWITVLIVLLSANSSFAKGGNETRSRKDVRFEINAKPWGPTPNQMEAARQRVLSNSQALSTLSGTNHRLLIFESIDRADANKFSLSPTHFRAFFYDYTNDRAYVAKGDYAGREPISFEATDWSPNVSATGEEIEDAFSVISEDPKLGSLYKSAKIVASPAMPPLSFVNGERLVNILVHDVATGADKIVGISFKNRSVVDYGSNAPSTGQLGTCGILNSGQGSSSSGTGTLQLSTELNGQTLWEMLVVRPAMSSGNPNEGSGIEVRDVKYKGKSVLKRGHAPILNVKYLSSCGPYRDWQDSEGYFDAPDAGSQTPLAGYKILANGQVAKTAVESGSDTGNFQGVAIYQQDNGSGIELVLVTEMNAGWYRYIMEWRFAADGTIRPRYGFGSVANGCVCIGRNHHVYWRFDFDVVNANNDVFKIERGRKFLTPITAETKMFRNYQTNRAILIKNSTGDEAYEIVPNITDEEAYYELPGGSLETFGSGDLWLLRFAGTAQSPGELDDPNSSAAANIDPWVSGQSLGNSDAVVWYGAHQFRNDATSLTNFDRSGLVLGGIHVVGPDLRPVRW